MHTDTGQVVTIDVSQFQGAIDWAAVKAAGIDQAYVRTMNPTQRFGPDGPSEDDGRAAEYYRQAGAAGVDVGPYLLVSPSAGPAPWESGDAQIGRWVDKYNAIGPWKLPPMLDIEPDSPWDKAPTDYYVGWMREAIAAVEAHDGRPPLLYGGHSFLATFVAPGGPLTAPVIVASWPHGNTPPPTDAAGMTDLATVGSWVSAARWLSPVPNLGPVVGWQFTSSGAVPGISGRCDLNLFQPSWLQTQPSDITKEPPAMFVADPRNGEVFLLIVQGNTWAKVNVPGPVWYDVLGGATPNGNPPAPGQLVAIVVGNVDSLDGIPVAHGDAATILPTTLTLQGANVGVTWA